MNDELLDYYDQNGKVIGHCSRSESETKNYIIANVIIFVFTTGGKVLLQKRASTKKHYPGLWDPSACGAIGHGEKPVVAAERELFEEIGIRCQLQFVERFMQSFPSEDGKLIRTRLSHLFVGTSDDKPIHNHEVDEIGSFGSKELSKMARSRPEAFVPSFEIEFTKALNGYKS